MSIRWRKRRRKWSMNVSGGEMVRGGGSIRWRNSKRGRESIRWRKSRRCGKSRTMRIKRAAIN